MHAKIRIETAVRDLELIREAVWNSKLSLGPEAVREANVAYLVALVCALRIEGAADGISSAVTGP